MNRDQDQLFADHDKLLHHLAHRNISRLTQVGCCIDVEELYGIFCEVFVVALQTWNANESKLSTYLTTACLNKVSRLLKVYHLGDNITDRESVIFERIEKKNEFFDVDIFVDNQSHHILGSYEVMEALNEEAKSLSPFAKILLEYTLNPPDFIVKELQAQEAKHQMSLEQCELPTYRRKMLNINFVARCLIKTVEDDKAIRFIRASVNEVKTAVMRATN